MERTLRDRLLRVADEIEQECPVTADRQGVLGMLHTIAAATQDAHCLHFLTDVMHRATIAMRDGMLEKIARNN